MTRQTEDQTQEFIINYLSQDERLLTETLYQDLAKALHEEFNLSLIKARGILKKQLKGLYRTNEGPFMEAI